MLFWALKPRLILVVGPMYFGIHRSTLIGNITLGMDSFEVTPNSEILKNLLLSATSFEAPNEPFPDSCKISAPLKTFLKNNEPLKPIPSC